MLSKDPKESLQLALEAGVKRVITIGTGPEDFDKILSLTQAHQPHVYGTLGVHPHDASSLDEATYQYMDKNLSLPEIVALGEIGLDYYYKHSPIEVQKQAFRRQLQLAIDHNLPVEIHTRDAEEDTVAILNEFKGQVKGLIHCFTGTQFFADAVLHLGLNISISGVVTFKKAEELRQVVKSLPLDRIHLETDAPFLTPMPFRGKENTPAYVIHTGRFVAGLMEVTEEEIAQKTCENARKMFPKLRWEV